MSFVPSFIRGRYRVKFALSILLVLAVISTVGFVVYNDTDHLVSRDAEYQLEGSATVQAEAVSSFMSSMRVQTRTTSADESFDEDDTQAAQSYITEASTRLSLDVQDIHYVDYDDQTVLASTDPEKQGASFSGSSAPWADSSVIESFGSNEDEVWNSQRAYDSPDTNEKVMAFASPTGEDGRAVVLVSSVENNIRSLSQSGAKQSTVVLSGGGSNPTAVLSTDEKEYEFDEGALEEARDQGEVSSRQTTSGTVQAYAPVEGADWVTLTTVPESEAYVVRDAVGWNTGLLIIASFISLLIMGAFLGRQTVIPLVDLKQKAEQIENGDLNTPCETNRVDEVGQLYGAFDNMQTALRQQIESARSARKEAERERDRIERINEHLEGKADDYANVMQRCAQGELTERMDPESENAAMTEIAEEFNEMMTELERTIAELSLFANDVAATSEEVTASAEEVRSASQQVSESIQEISAGADRQSENLQAASAEMDELSTTIEEIAASSQEVANHAERFAKEGQRGRKAAQKAIEGMEDIQTDSMAAVEEIEQLDDEMEQIDELLEFIRDVADQTNMLALNANIEASRSADGDEGEGFSVVAEEVKELSEEAKQAADDIEDRLTRIKGQTDRTVSAVRNASQQVEENTDAIQQAIQSLTTVAQNAESTYQGIREISTVTEKQATSTQEVVAIVEDIASIGAETSSEAETVAAAAEEQTTALTEVTDNATGLSSQANRLNQALDQFETDVPLDPGPGSSSGVARKTDGGYPQPAFEPSDRTEDADPVDDTEGE
jgi:methyl-accepting chemotaxis protein